MDLFNQKDGHSSVEEKGSGGDVARKTKKGKSKAALEKFDL